MYFLNTDMHVVTFLITVFEIAMLVVQVIYFLQRPSDKGRLLYLILLLCLIAHNICSGLFPDPQFAIPEKMQIVIAYLVAFIMSMYVVYYFYKVFELHHLRFFATYGVLIFLFFPFVFLFLVPYLVTNDLRLSAKLTVIIPFFYAIGFIYHTGRALLFKFSEARKTGSVIHESLYEHAAAVFLSTICWASLPVIVFFGDFQVLEHSITNAGFLFMTIIYVRSAIKQARNEHEQLLESERNLRELNKSLKAKVKKRTKKLERLMEHRRTTFINLAHETKTPLTLINNYLSDYIHRHGGDEELGIVKSNLDRLTADMVNFFDVESMEKGFNIYNHDEISNFSSLVSSKLFLFEALAKKKNITLQHSLEPSLTVRAHPGAIDRITNNLLENALKYTDANGIVTVELFRENDWLVLLVKDTGPGIPRELQQKIFQPYFKLAIAGRNSEGMGMGLSIVKKIVDDLKGTILLNSEEDFGTEIKIFLPFPTINSAKDESANHIEARRISLLEQTTDERKSSILLVEDNTQLMHYLAAKLKDRYNLILAQNGDVALTKIETLSSLDIIVSDVMMKGMDGFELCKILSSDKKFAHIPFLFLSAKSTADDRLKGLSLGAVDYIQKPFEMEELIVKIDSILSNLKKQREAVVNKAYASILEPRRESGHDSFLINCEKYRLTAREVEIVELMMQGQPYKEIGDQLSISDKTVSKHVSNIFSKVCVNNKVELINKLDAD